MKTIMQVHAHDKLKHKFFMFLKRNHYMPSALKLLVTEACIPTTLINGAEKWLTKHFNLLCCPMRRLSMLL